MSVEEIEQAVKATIESGHGFLELLKSIRPRHRFDKQQSDNSAEEFAGYRAATMKAISSVRKMIRLLSSRSRIIKKGHARVRRGPAMGKSRTINIDGVIIKEGASILMGFQANNVPAAINKNAGHMNATTIAGVEMKRGTTGSNMATLLKYHNQLLQRQQTANGIGRSTAAARMALHHHRRPQQPQRFRSRNTATNSNTIGPSPTLSSFLSSLNRNRSDVINYNHVVKDYPATDANDHCLPRISYSQDSSAYEAHSCGFNGRCYCGETRRAGQNETVSVLAATSKGSLDQRAAWKTYEQKPNVDCHLSLSPCAVRKHAEKPIDDPTMAAVTYEGDHSHPILRTRVGDMLVGRM